MSTWAELKPLVMPAGWHFEDDCASGQGSSYRHTDGRVLLVSVRVEMDDRAWLHASVSLHNRLPTWRELREVKDWIVGPKRPAYQIFPRAEDYVNIHPYVLHLWAPLEGDDPIPRFNRDPERMGGI